MPNICRCIHRSLCIAVCLGLLSCGQRPPSSKQPKGPVTITPEKITELEYQTDTEKLWSASPVSCGPLVSAVEKLASDIRELLANPTDASLQAAQQQWKAVAVSFGNLYLFTTMAEVLPQVFTEISQLSWRVAAQPVQPGYLDAFGPYRYSGLVNDIGVALTPESLAAQHGFTDDSEIVLGLYSLEFMLFGELLNREESAFARSDKLTQSQIDAGFKQLEETPRFRRRTMLSSQTQLLEGDMKALCQKIQSNTNTRSAEWRSMPANQRIDAIHRAMQRALQQSDDFLALQLAKNTDSEETDYQHLYVLSEAEQARLLSNRLRSLASTQGYVASAELYSLLDAVAEKLSTYADSAADSDAEQPAPWQQTREDLAKSMQLLDKARNTQADAPTSMEK